MVKRVVSLFVVTFLLVTSVSPFAARKKKKEVNLPPLQQCLKDYHNGNYKKALSSAIEARKANPKDPGVAEAWGRINLAMGRPATAIGALNILCRERGTAADYRLLALANNMLGRTGAAAAALKKMGAAQDVTAEDLYAIARSADDAPSCLAALKRMAADFPETSTAVAPEIAFWSSKGTARLRAPSRAAGPKGIELHMKTLYNLEWLVSKTADNKDLWLLIDTAARQTVISTETAEHLGLKDITQAAFPLPGSYEGEPAHRYTLLKSLDIGGYEIDNVPALVVKDAAGLLRFREGRVVPKGILGMDLLGKFNFRFDRTKMTLTLFPRSVTGDALKGETGGDWKERPAFLANDQIVTPSSLGEKNPLLAVVDTGSTFVMAATGVVKGTGLRSTSRNRVNLTPSANFIMPEGSIGTPMAQISRLQSYIMGWMNEALPLTGEVRTIPRGAVVGFAGKGFNITYLPLYPKTLGSSDLPVGLYIGRKITDFYTLAFDFKRGKMYAKQVLFKKK